MLHTNPFNGNEHDKNLFTSYPTGLLFNLAILDENQSENSRIVGFPIYFPIIVAIVCPSQLMILLSNASYFYFTSRAYVHVIADFYDQKHIIPYHS